MLHTEEFNLSVYIWRVQYMCAFSLIYIK